MPTIRPQGRFRNSSTRASLRLASRVPLASNSGARPNGGLMTGAATPPGWNRAKSSLSGKIPSSQTRPKTRTRSQKLRPYGLKNEDTRNFLGQRERSQILRHYGAFHGLKNEDTSISTSTTGSVCADGDVRSPVGGVAAEGEAFPRVADAALLPADDWRRNGKSPTERLNGDDDDLRIPDFLRRTLS